MLESTYLVEVKRQNVFIVGVAATLDTNPEGGDPDGRVIHSSTRFSQDWGVTEVLGNPQDSKFTAEPWEGII